MSRVRRLALPQRVVLVAGLGLCLLCAWSWWYAGTFADSVQTAADFLRTQTERSATDVPPQETIYFGVTSGGWRHLAVPVGLVVLWTAVSVWLLGSSPEGSESST